MMKGATQKLVLGIGGASGSIYARLLMETLAQISDQWEEVGVVISENGLKNWELENGVFVPEEYPYTFYNQRDFSAPFASGSAKYQTVILCPCSMGLLSRVANGVSADLLSRAADVALKERRKLIAVVREAPLSLIHINNMKTLTEAGGIICPAIPSFYSGASTVQALAMTVVYRVLDLAGFEIESFRWGETK